MKLYHIFPLVLFSVGASAQNALRINEVMATNETSLSDETGAEVDWVEIYNPGNAPVDLAGFHITDDFGEPEKYQIPKVNTTTVIEPGEFKILFASDDVSRGPLHLPFKLSADGEELAILDSRGRLQDSLSFGPQLPDISFGRLPDGGDQRARFKKSTPGESNSEGEVYRINLGRLNFSQEAGAYSEAFKLTLAHSDPEALIYYTLDGSDPSADNLNGTSYAIKNKYNEAGTKAQSSGKITYVQYQTSRYQAAIDISDRSRAPNVVSQITTSPSFSPPYIPNEPIYKGTVVKAIAVKGEDVSPVETRTYFVGENATTRYQIPVISITTAPQNYFGYADGIYVPGSRYDLWQNPNMPAGFCSAGNFSLSGAEGERPAHIEIFDTGKLSLSQNIQTRLHGNCTLGNPRKNIRIYSDSTFGYPFFGADTAQYARLIIRTSGNDDNVTIFKDVFAQTLVQHLSFDVQHSRPCVLFINSEYWGIHAVRERFDNRYVESRYGVDRDSVDLISVEGAEVEEGDSLQYQALNDFVINNSLADSIGLQKISEMIDVENFTDYFINGIYANSHDWPFKNVRLWRKRTNGLVHEAPSGHDGRWRWMLYDMDLSYDGPETNFTARVLDDDYQATLMLRKLLTNPVYKRDFLNRTADLMNTAFLPSRAQAVLDSIKNLYATNIDEHIARWKAPPARAQWDLNIQRISKFVNERQGYFRSHLRGILGATLSDAKITLDISHPKEGFITINKIDLRPTTLGIREDPYPWSGTYYANNLVTLKANPALGWELARWEDGEGNTVGESESLTINPSNGAVYKAVLTERALALAPNEIDFYVSPNPANNDFLTLNISKAALGGNYRVLDPLGNERIGPTKMAKSSVVRINKLAPGQYIILYTDPLGAVFTRKFVKAN